MDDPSRSTLKVGNTDCFFVWTSSMIEKNKYL